MEVIIPFLVIGFFLGSVIVHIALANAVWADGARLDREGRPTFFVGPMLWAFMTLMGGLFVVTVYWLMHHSTLRRES